MKFLLQAARNADANNGTPIEVPEGAGHCADPQQQIHVDRLASRQCTDTALVAGCKGPEARAATGSFVTIQQGTTDLMLIILIA